MLFILLTLFIKLSFWLGIVLGIVGILFGLAHGYASANYNINSNILTKSNHRNYYDYFVEYSNSICYFIIIYTMGYFLLGLIIPTYLLCEYTLTIIKKIHSYFENIYCAIMENYYE